MRKVCQRSSLVAVLVGVLGTLQLVQAETAQAESGIVGIVISTTGAVYAEGPEGPRSLECGTPIRKGERVITPNDASVGFMSADVYVQLDGDTDVAVDRSASGAPLFTVTAGRARVVDTREAGDALVIRAPGSTASGVGTDTEVAVAGDRTEYCEGGAELGVEAGGEVLTAQSGECLTFGSGAAPTTSSKVAGGLPLGGAGCVAMSIVDHFTPEVAALPLTISLAPIDPNRRLIGPCDDPGSGCSRSFPPLGIVPVIIDQPTIIEQVPVPILGPSRSRN
jgi:hypothetical protein